MNAAVHPIMCNGCRLCEQLCPAVFFMQNGKAAIGVPQITPDLESACYTVARQCPVSAIVIGQAQALMRADTPSGRRCWIAL